MHDCKYEKDIQELIKLNAVMQERVNSLIVSIDSLRDKVVKISDALLEHVASGPFYRGKIEMIESQMALQFKHLQATVDKEDKIKNAGFTKFITIVSLVFRIVIILLAIPTFMLAVRKIIR